MYCTRTVPEMEKVLTELKELVDYRQKYFLGPGEQAPQILALGLSSRKNLCIHPKIAGMPLLSQGIGPVYRGSTSGFVVLHCRPPCCQSLRRHAYWEYLLQSLTAAPS